MSQKTAINRGLKNQGSLVSSDKNKLSSAPLEILPEGQKVIGFKAQQKKNCLSLKNSTENSARSASALAKATSKKSPYSLKKEGDSSYQLELKAGKRRRPKHSKALLKEVLEWLSLQPHQFAAHIKDMDVAVKMYLKVRKHKKSSFKKERERQEELKQLLAQGTNQHRGAKNSKDQNAPAVVLMNKQYSFDFSPPKPSESGAIEFKPMMESHQMESPQAGGRTAELPAQNSQNFGEKIGEKFEKTREEKLTAAVSPVPPATSPSNPSPSNPSASPNSPLNPYSRRVTSQQAEALKSSPLHSQQAEALKSSPLHSQQAEALKGSPPHPQQTEALKGSPPHPQQAEALKSASSPFPSPSPSPSSSPPALKGENDEAKGLFSLDEKSLQALRKTKEDFNLEKEREALRLLIQLGRKQIEKNFLP